jgi:hypothetical protein
MWLSRVVGEYLLGGADRVCVFEDWIASPGSALVANSDLRPYVFENIVYFALFHEDAENRERIESTIQNAEDVWLFYGVISSLPEEMHLDPEGGLISGQIMEMLAQRAEKIVVGAYDGESYLIWSKPGA